MFEWILFLVFLASCRHKHIHCYKANSFNSFHIFFRSFVFTFGVRRKLEQDIDKLRSAGFEQKKTHIFINVIISVEKINAY